MKNRTYVLSMRNLGAYMDQEGKMKEDSASMHTHAFACIFRPEDAKKQTTVISTTLIIDQTTFQLSAMWQEILDSKILDTKMENIISITTMKDPFRGKAWKAI